MMRVIGQIAFPLGIGLLAAGFCAAMTGDKGGGVLAFLGGILAAGFLPRAIREIRKES